jgi:hypothetical protein
MSTPADEPQVRPSGSVPQLRVTVGAGFGMPSPEMGLPAVVAAGVPVPAGAVVLEPAPHPVSRTEAERQSAGSRGREWDMAAPCWP